MYESQKGFFQNVFYNQEFTAQENAKVSRKKLLFFFWRERKTSRQAMSKKAEKREAMSRKNN